MRDLAYGIVLMSLCMSLAFMPANASDFILEIFGNANMDDTINEDDVEYVRGIIEGTNEATELADANYDGEIDDDDITQIGQIIRGEEKGITIIDSADRTVTVKKPVERVVIAYWIDAALTLQALKAEDTVVGVTDVIKDEPILFPELSKLPSVGLMPDYDALDFEKILELEPDVVFTGGTSENPTTYIEIENKIHSMNPDIAVLVFEFATPARYPEEVTKVGEILNRRGEAKDLIDFIEEHVSPIKEGVEEIPEEDRTKVYTEYFYDYFTISEDEYVEIAGGKNVFDDLPLTAHVDPEAVINRTPDIIIHHVGMAYANKVGYMTDDVSALRDKRNEIMNRPGFAAVPAVKTGDVYTSNSNILVGPMYPVGLAYYAKWFYPELFEDLDSNAIHQEYLTRFLRIDYDLSKHGVFVYHPEQHPEGR